MLKYLLCIFLHYNGIVCTKLVGVTCILCFLRRLYNGKLSNIVLYIYYYLKGVLYSINVFRSSNTELYMFESIALIVHIFLSFLSISVQYFYTLYITCVIVFGTLVYCACTPFLENIVAQTITSNIYK